MEEGWGSVGLLSLSALAQQEESSWDKQPRGAGGWQQGFAAGPAIPSGSFGRRSWRASLGNEGWRPRVSMCRECSWCCSSPAAAQGLAFARLLLQQEGAGVPEQLWDSLQGPFFLGERVGWEAADPGSSATALLPKSTPQDAAFGLKCQLCCNSVLLDSARRIQALLNHFRDKHTADNVLLAPWECCAQFPCQGLNFVLGTMRLIPG